VYRRTKGKLSHKRSPEHAVHSTPRAFPSTDHTSGDDEKTENFFVSKRTMF
jgi:hypothetical protein